MGLEEKCGKKKGSRDPGVERLAQAKAKGRTGGRQGVTGQPGPAPTAAVAPDTGTLAARAKKCKAEMWPTREALRKWVPAGRSQLDREGMAPPEAPQWPREAGGRQERAPP